MNTAKPKDICEYKEWLKEKHNIEISDRTKNRYESVTSKSKQELETSELWTKLFEKLKEYDDEYKLIKDGYPLLWYEHKPVIDIKPYDSFLLKAFRKNVLQNENWPNEPKGGWILPNNWFIKINDILRTLFVVKYLDGVEFLIEKIKTYCEQNNRECEVTLEAREEGYYAAHLYTKREFEIPRETWDTEKINMTIEIQVTTQLQENIRRLLHKYYEQRRKLIKEEEIKWQWNYKGDEFVANYLGHILHYVEGMIMEIRERQKEKMS
jgi:hypothetical protein